VEALVTPQLLQWARRRRSLRVEEAAEKINIHPDRLSKWEKGEGNPTFKQAKTLAEKLYVPFGYLFLPNPPTEDLPLPDFRTITSAQESLPSPDFLDVLRDTLRKQEWYREYQEGIGAEPLDFIGRFTQDENPVVVASNIRDTLNLDSDMREEANNWEQFLQEFIRRVEKAGVLVLRNGVVGNNTHRPLNVEEFRGFVISDSLAPIIFINGKDAKTAQIFTLAHELAHLWMGQSGVSNPNYFNRLVEPQNIAEKIANQVAAETLLPSSELISIWDNTRDITNNIDNLARIYRISKFVVLRRAFDNEKVSDDEYFNYYRDLLNERHVSTGSTGGNFYRSLVARNSSTFTHTILIACAEGKASRKEASSLLNVKVKSLPSIQREILGG